MLVIWKMGILKPQTQERGTVGFSQLYVTDFSASSVSDQIQVSIESSSGAEVTIPGSRISTTLDGVSCSLAPGSPVVIAPGESQAVTIDCSGPPSLGERYTTGDFFKANIIINYTITRTGREHLSKGKIYGPVEAA